MFCFITSSQFFLFVGVQPLIDCFLFLFFFLIFLIFPTNNLQLVSTQAENVLIRGDDGSWEAPPNVAARGKLKHIASAMTCDPNSSTRTPFSVQKLSKQTPTQTNFAKTLLIDDDSVNVKASEDVGGFAVQFQTAKMSNPDHVLARNLVDMFVVRPNSLLRLQTPSLTTPTFSTPQRRVIEMAGCQPPTNCFATPQRSETDFCLATPTN